MNLTDKIQRCLENCLENEGGCKLYQGGLQSGYAMIYHDGVHRGAHIYLWQRLNGVLAHKKRLMNVCGNRNCLNVKHWNRASMPFKVDLSRIPISSGGTNHGKGGLAIFKDKRAAIANAEHVYVQDLVTKKWI